MNTANRNWLCKSKPNLNKNAGEKETSQFWKPAKMNLNFCQRRNQSRKKSRELENLLIENQTQTLTWRNAAAKKWFWISELNPKRNFATQRRIWFCSWLANGVRHLRVGGRGQNSKSRILLGCR
jgi:hypothetical protein